MPQGKHKPPDPELEQQAIGRIHRIGQAARPCVERLVTEGTVEESILAMVARKRRLEAARGSSATADSSSSDLAAAAAAAEAAPGGRSGRAEGAEDLRTVEVEQLFGLSARTGR